MKLYNGDCLNVMREKILSEEVDLVVTSPPYDNLRTYGGIDWNFDIFKPIAKELYRIIKPGGVVVWVVGDATIKGSETGTSFKQALYFKEIGFNLHDTMIYKKEGLTFPDTTRYYQNFEYMFVLSKGMPRVHNPIKDRFNKNYGQKNYSTQREKDGVLRKQHGYGTKLKVKCQHGVRYNIWEYSTGKNKSTKDNYAFGVPAIFPEKLAKDHIISWSNKNDVVMDPFMGSGTTGKMAKQLNRNFIGIELNQEYFEIAEKRIDKYNK